MNRMARHQLADDAMFRRLAMFHRQNRQDANPPPPFNALELMMAPHGQRVPAGVREVRCERITVHGNTLTYSGQEDGRVGLYVAVEPLSKDSNYFEVEVMDTGVLGAIVFSAEPRLRSLDLYIQGVGLVPGNYPLDSQPGWNADSIGYHADDGKLFKSNAHGRPFGPESNAGDRIGCGINLTEVIRDDRQRQMVPVLFTHNGKEIGSVLTVLPADGLYPAIGMHSDGEEVKLNLDARWQHSDVTLMSIDSCEEDWARLHDVRINGQLLEYVGRGKSIIDVGLAQARHPLTTRYHYYELQIVDPGENCYVAIGLAHRSYPRRRHPGWNKGSIAYHADDGKIFIGCGVGEPFGPECNKGDVMGCGILFPRDYRREWDDDVDDAATATVAGGDDVNDEDHGAGDAGFSSSESEDEQWWQRPNHDSGTKVQVFFTRNGKTIGKREVRIPKGGFFPTVGMLSSDEKVRVDLRPLTG